ncbi:MAG TPA: heavy metal translocating P-type ATPase [Allocoleopsis sp.]
MQVVPPQTSSAPTPTVDVSQLDVFTLDVGGMKCAGCVKAVEDELTQQTGVQSAIVNLVTQVALVKCEPGVVDPETLAQRLTDAGFPSQSRSTSSAQNSPKSGVLSLAERQKLETQQQIRRAAVATSLLFISTLGHLNQFGWFPIPGLDNIWLHWGLATLALVGPGRSILTDGWRGLRRNAPNMNTLVGLGTTTAYVASVIALLFPGLGWECFFDEPVMLVGFILLGRTLEQYARGRAAEAFQSLLALQPTTAKLVSDQQINRETESVANPSHWHPLSAIEIPAEQVKVGEWLQVLPGEKFPVDGEIVIGQTTVNEAMLTGEALPVTKQVGDPVAAGSLNLSGAIVFQATRTGKDTTLAKIIALVEEAQTRKAPIQRLADTIAGYFTYGVMTIALLTFLFWYFVGVPLWGEHIFHTAHSLLHAHSLIPLSHHLVAPSPLLLSLKLSIAVLVIACPCALGLATPTAILVGSGIGAERGLLIRGGDVLEQVHQLNTIVFDKTGTLTIGRPTVTDCIPCIEALTPAQLLQIAATVESGTQHPLAEAIGREAQHQELISLPAQAFHTEPGLGVAAQVENQLTLIGTATWLEQHGITIPETALSQAQSLAKAGKTIVYVGIANQFAGLIAAQDTLRSDARTTVDRLKQMGLRVMLITGDQPEAAEAVAHSLGLSEKDSLAKVLPGMKGAVIAQMQQQGQQVAMVGDGINDAPALAQANVGISLHSATDVAIEMAGIVLMRDRLSDVVTAIHLSRATFNKIRQNLFWAFFYNLLGIPIAAGILLPSFGILLSPATAGAFMAFSSVSVVTNSLLLRRSWYSK